MRELLRDRLAIGRSCILDQIAENLDNVIERMQRSSQGNVGQSEHNDTVQAGAMMANLLSQHREDQWSDLKYSGLKNIYEISVNNLQNNTLYQLRTSRFTFSLLRTHAILEIAATMFSWILVDFSWATDSFSLEDVLWL